MALAGSICGAERHRNAEERFDNAAEMLRDWRRAFEPLDRGAIAEDSIETIARRLDRRSTIAELG